MSRSITSQSNLKHLSQEWTEQNPLSKKEESPDGIYVVKAKVHNLKNICIRYAKKKSYYFHYLQTCPADESRILLLSCHSYSA